MEFIRKFNFDHLLGYPHDYWVYRGNIGVADQPLWSHSLNLINEEEIINKPRIHLILGMFLIGIIAKVEKNVSFT